MECLRLIANPIHLINEKKKKEQQLIPCNPKVDFNSNLREIINEKYKKVYLSDLNFKEIILIVDNYIDDILIHRIISDCITNIIDNILENSDKFDFCLPFD